GDETRCQVRTGAGRLLPAGRNYVGAMSPALSMTGVLASAPPSVALVVEKHVDQNHFREYPRRPPLEREGAMDVVHPRCCGLDVHKQTVVACALITSSSGRAQKEVRTFGTMTHELLALGDWLASLGIRQVALEATGAYWKPIWNLLEDYFELLLVNAQHIKAVPGRKTGCQRRRMDRRSAQARSAHSELRARSCATRITRAHALSDV